MRCGRGPDAAQVIACRLVQSIPVILDQRLAEAVDTAQRRPQIMRDGITERFELLVLVFQFFDECRPCLRQFARGACLARFHLAAQQLVANAPILVLELLAPNLCLDSRPQYVELVRFGDVVIGARAQSFDQRLPILHRGQHDQRGIAQHGRCLDAAARLLPTHAGHHQIQEDTVDVLHGKHVDGLLPGVSQYHIIALVAQRRRELLQVRHAVVHGQNPFRARQTRCRLRLRPRCPEHGCKARENDVHVLFFAHEGVGAGIQSPQLHPLLVRSGQQQTGQAAQRSVQAQPADHRCAVDARHDAIVRWRPAAGCRPAANPFPRNWR